MINLDSIALASGGEEQQRRQNQKTPGGLRAIIQSGNSIGHSTEH
jgi:hypothetical protein